MKVKFCVVSHSVKRSRKMQLPLSACGSQRAMALLVVPLLIVGLVAAVPASVLAQNTEIATNANSKQLQQQQEPVNRADNANVATAIAANKKSSPEIVPATFSNTPAKNTNNNHAQQAQPKQQQAGIYALPSNDEILAAVAAAAQSSQLQDEQQALEAEAGSNMRKRGINYDYNPYPLAAADYGPYAAAAPAAVMPAAVGYGNDVPNGVWADEYEPPVHFSERELQELEDYVPERRVSNTNARSKAYDNLQNLLNAEAYLESIPMSVPLQYANRNYDLDADRNKRGSYYNMGNNGENLNKYRRYGDMRLKRDTGKLTPADMLALVALVEAGERARKENNVDVDDVPMADSYAPKNYEVEPDMDYVGGAAAAGVGVPQGVWLDSPPAMVDYLGMPLNVEAMPKYEYLPRPHKYANNNNNNNRLGANKRFMVAKKKRSISPFMNEPVAERGPHYNGEKYY